MKIQTFGDFECLCMEDRFLFLYREMSDGSLSDVAHLSFEAGFHYGGFELLYHTVARDIPDKILITPPVTLDFLKVFEGKGEFYEFEKNGGVLFVKAEVSFDPFAWKSSTPIRIFMERLSEQLVSRGLIDVSVSEETDFGDSADSFIRFSFVVSSNESIETACERVRRVFGEAAAAADIGMYEFFSEFDVPEEKRFVISQYLSYFGQFLVDIGIPADCEVAVNDSTLSLSVSPKNKSEAIENIHAALAAYLSLADGGDLVVTPKDDSVAMVKYQQLLANVEHMNEQFRRYDSLVSAGDHVHLERRVYLLEQTMQAQRLVNGKAAEMIRVEDALEPTEGIKIKKYKGSFLEIDVPKLWRRLSKRK